MAAKPENNSIPNPTASSQSNNKVHSSDDSEADPNSYLLEKFKLYETRAVLILQFLPSSIHLNPNATFG